ncbi:hypothetical protein HYV82_00545 [Candidatus Woesearchaeota archaeon]|nr:hypothetical protein [Candidatus Woesearchaeota archaeon]
MAITRQVSIAEAFGVAEGRADGECIEGFVTTVLASDHITLFGVSGQAGYFGVGIPFRLEKDEAVRLTAGDELRLLHLGEAAKYRPVYRLDIMMSDGQSTFTYVAGMGIGVP